jgi:hypothetical protein
MTEYGTPDSDTAPLDTLKAWLLANSQEAVYIMHYQRVPIDARPCQLPTSLKVQAVLEDGRTVTAFQPSIGAAVQIKFS